MRTARSLFLVLVGAVPAQAVIPVSGGGAALQTAVTAAPNGAVLVVAPGQYAGCTIVDKDLTIVAPLRATVVGPITATPATGSFVQRALRLVRLDVVHQPVAQWPFFVAGRIVTRDHLFVEACTCDGIDVNLASPNGTTRTVVVADSTVNAAFGGGQSTFVEAALLFVDSSFAGGQRATSPSSTIATVGLNLSLCDLRAERIVVTGGSYAGAGALALSAIASTGTIAGSQLLPGGPGVASLNWFFGTCTLWSTAMPGGGGTVSVRRLATAAWQQRQWTPGGTSNVVLTEAPNKAMAMVASWRLVPGTSSAALETLWVGITPDWVIAGLGIADAQGAYATTFTIPNAPALLYASAWLSGIAFDPLPLRSTVPIGGTIL